MKNRIVVLLSLLVCACTSENQYNIKADISDLKDKYVYYTNDGEKIDSTEVKNGSFCITGLYNKPEMIEVFNKSQSFYTPVLLEKGDIKIKGSINNFSFESELNKMYNYLAHLEGKIDRKYPKYEEKYLAEEEWIDSLVNISTKNTNNYACLMNLNNILMFSPSSRTFVDKLEKVKSNLSAFKDEVSYKKLSYLITAMKRREVGQTLFDYKICTTSKDSVNLHSVLGKDITIIDIWASYCSFCRKLTPKYKAAYEKYKHKGLKIVMLSNDNKYKEWIKAIKEDKTEHFTHVSSLKGSADKFKGYYRIYGIPSSIIVDKSGKIIANDRRDIMNFLDEYYSSKK